MTSEEKTKIIEAAADEIKAGRIELIEVKQKTSIADYFVICSGTSDRHVTSIADKVAEKMKLVKERPLRVEGERSGWILHDYGDVIFHVMREEERQYFDLESFWKNRQVDTTVL